MSNYAWVCFDCRMAVRRHGQSTTVRCPSCGKSCECLGYKTPIPPKAKTRKWEKLRIRYFELKWQFLLKQQALRVRIVHNLEQEISRLSAMPKNPGRLATISYLSKQLESVRSGHKNQP